MNRETIELLKQLQTKLKAGPDPKWVQHYKDLADGVLECIGGPLDGDRRSETLIVLRDGSYRAASPVKRTAYGWDRELEALHWYPFRETK